MEITTLLIPGQNDSDAELTAMCRWIMAELGPDVPLHFSAFHPDWKMRDIPATSAVTLSRARAIARHCGLHYVYTGNVHDQPGGSTYCPTCNATLIGRDWYELTGWNLTGDAACPQCGTKIAGHFNPQPGNWGRKRQQVQLRNG